MVLEYALEFKSVEKIKKNNLSVLLMNSCILQTYQLNYWLLAVVDLWGMLGDQFPQISRVHVREDSPLSDRQIGIIFMLRNISITNLCFHSLPNFPPGALRPQHGPQLPVYQTMFVSKF